MNRHQKLLFTNGVAEALEGIIADTKPSRLFVITDDNVSRLVLPMLPLGDIPVIAIAAGDINKNTATLMSVWSAMQDAGLDRHSLVINLGGGMVTDLGGFAASTFKRGVRFVNIPTTLLAAVDAAVGGKTGINFGGYKNEIGVFNEADAVIISTRFFSTLPSEELKSGYAEMLKHGLIEGEGEFHSLLSGAPGDFSPEELLDLLRRSVEVKRRIVEADPTEKGLRKALNLGHTAGHAFESLALRRGSPVPHGYAVAWGCVVELVLSHLLEGFPSADLHLFAGYVRRNYGAPSITCNDYDELLDLMSHDKKNSSGHINFTLLRRPGELKLDVTPPRGEITAALDIFRDLSGI